MAEIVTAVYEKSVLRLLQPLNLREQQTVCIQIMPEEVEDESEAAVRILAEAGLLTPPPRRSPGVP
jgi:predicted DNA-binding antitoxin AbrB/MazE fold protein